MRDLPPGCLRLVNPGPLQAFLASVVVGLSIGLADANSSQNGNLIALVFLLVCVVLMGAWSAGTAWVCWLPLGTGIYFVHIAAIARGYKQPYVEENAQAALVTLSFLYPVGFGLGLGVGLRILLSSLGLLRRPDGSPVRILPRTTRGWLTTIAGLGLAFGLLSWVSFDSSTVYSTRYSESAFQRIQIGTPAAEIEEKLGPPLSKHLWGNDGAEFWEYTRGATATSDYWRRWIGIEDGKVRLIVSDYWWD